MINTSAAPSSEQELKYSYDGCTELISVFSDVRYISSAGLHDNKNENMETDTTTLTVWSVTSNSAEWEKQSAEQYT